MDDVGSQSENSDQESEHSEESKSLDENPEDEQSEEADFTKVKLSSKHAAFLRKTSGEKWFLCYST
jgi:hypothetical protein